MRFQVFLKTTTLQGLYDKTEEEDEDEYAEAEGEEEEDELGGDPVVEMPGSSGSGKARVGKEGEKVEGKEAVEGETQKKAKSPKPVVPENVVVAPGEGEVKPAEAPRAESPASPPAMVSEKSSY